MSNGALAKRYSTALLLLGNEHNCVDVFDANLQDFKQALALSDNLLQRSLIAPVLTKPEKQKVLMSVLERLEFHSLCNNFLRLLVEKDRMVLFNDISEIYRQLTDAQEGRVRAVVSTARELDVREKAEVQEALAGASDVEQSKLLIDYSIDPSLIGGIVAKVGDKLFDASIRSRIEHLRDELI